jgi:hypothetical protein
MLPVIVPPLAKTTRPDFSETDDGRVRRQAFCPLNIAAMDDWAILKQTSQPFSGRDADLAHQG